MATKHFCAYLKERNEKRSFATKERVAMNKVEKLRAIGVDKIDISTLFDRSVFVDKKPIEKQTHLDLCLKHEVYHLTPVQIKELLWCKRYYVSEFQNSEFSSENFYRAVYDETYNAVIILGERHEKLLFRDHKSIITRAVLPNGESVFGDPVWHIKDGDPRLEKFDFGKNETKAENLAIQSCINKINKWTINSTGIVKRMRQHKQN